MRWGMVVDLSKCVRCYACLAACRIEHFLPMGINWPRLVALETGGDSPTVSTYSVRCNQCKDAPCVEVCPTGATTRREDGVVTVDQDKCVGCRYCVVACPYQNRTFLSKDKDQGFFPGRVVTDFEKAGKKLYKHQIGTTEKCNFCAERIDAGLAKGLKPGIDREATPACVNTCPARALTFGDLDDPNSEVSRLIREKKGFQLHPEYNTDPSVYFIDGKIGQSDEPKVDDKADKEPEAIGVGE
ncbi:MAG: 4Fe-4S dicluster domain-containing protein [Dehalococcoidales bacterium]|nr:4Fe-4S dicluster domain-containing protein [Dehalococcoidales bacterium]